MGEEYPIIILNKTAETLHQVVIGEIVGIEEVFCAEITDQIWETNTPPCYRQTKALMNMPASLTGKFWTSATVSCHSMWD